MELPNIENFSKAPPPIAFKSSKKPKLPVKSVVPGTLIEHPNMNSDKTPSVKRILCLKSLQLGENICLIVANILDHLYFSTCCFYLFFCSHRKLMCFYSQFLF